MSPLKLTYYGLSGLTWLIAFLCGAMVRIVLGSNWPLSVKAVSASLLFLIALLIFANDQDKVLTESVRSD